jgi:hypothetical protein
LRRYLLCHVLSTFSTNEVGFGDGTGVGLNVVGETVGVSVGDGVGGAVIVNIQVE